MDIKETVSSLVSKLTGDGDLLAKFKSNPLETVKGLVGDKLSGDQLSSIVDAVKAKLNLDNASDLLGKVGGLFGKK